MRTSIEIAEHKKEGRSIIFIDERRFVQNISKTHEYAWKFRLWHSRLGCKGLGECDRCSIGRCSFDRKSVLHSHQHSDV
ncbi:hypothetical protein [Holospora curviuscula]|uniref:hypothetical protein n=1 Tax=Holospora curviuscula TaxID=1082868 RepID=UPI00101AD0FB|nr:hypothetical protein [Holospora curviuscula]